MRDLCGDRAGGGDLWAPPILVALGLYGPGRIRTCDLGIKSPLLYQLSYRPAPTVLQRFVAQ
jgi:hypothetical protein